MIFFSSPVTVVYTDLLVLALAVGHAKVKASTGFLVDLSDWILI